MTKTDLIKIGVVGYGNRGRSMVKDVLLQLVSKEIEIVAVCDSYPDRAQLAADEIETAVGRRPASFCDYKELCDVAHPDALLIFSAWESHFDIAVYAMEHDIATAFEVGGAYTIDKLFELVRTHERTGVPCMMLENCCYGEHELMVLRMVREGLFGKIVHCSGGYHHDLRYEVAGGIEDRHYRLRNYASRNCENYPTHELGPIAKVLDINNGNRMLTLTSTASSAHGLDEYLSAHPEKGAVGMNFAQGDVVTTTIKCAGGQTIVLTLDTTLPRTYDRAFTVRGTKGGYFGITDSVYIDGKYGHEYEFHGEKLWGNARDYAESEKHPIWQNYDPRGGHGGMDYLVIEAFLEALRLGCRTPIDVYDAASWAAVSVLSEQSISLGGMPVAIPDFTNGKWLCRDDIADAPVTKYSLDDPDAAKVYRK